jgi:DNA-binding transcriptional LysR family regulator
LTLEQLRIFVFVAERLHMTRAARALGLTQSAASAAIAALERRYGVRLFDRVGRGLALTEAGRVFLPEATAVLLRSKAAEQSLIDLADLKLGTLTLAASQTVSSYWLPARLAAFAAAYPKVSLELAAGNTEDVVRQILSGQAELGFVEGAVDDHALLHWPVGEDSISLYAAPTNPLCGKVLLASALGETGWVLRERGSGTRSHFEQSMARAHLDPGALKVALELPSNEAVLSAAAGSQLVGAASDLAAAPFVTAGALVRLDFELGRRRFELLVHKERRLSAAAKAFTAPLISRPARIGA